MATERYSSPSLSVHHRTQNPAQREEPFIGTIQDFTHTFLAFPWLRSNGIVVESIDNARYEAATRSILQQNQYKNLCFALEKQRNAMSLAVSATYYFDPETDQLRIRELPFSEAAKSSITLSAIKKKLSDSGVYRYDDVFAIAAAYLHRRPWAARALRQRFPWVLIDEMQDTSAVQDELLTKIFDAQRSVLQRVGDLNQRIFSNDANNMVGTFPHPDQTLDLSRSRRFGPAIARTASRLTVTRNQRILGSTNAPEGTLAIITFNNDSILQVIPYFERMAAEKVSLTVLRDNPPRVLGGRIDPGTSNQVPRALTCYAPHLAAAPNPADASRLLTAAQGVAKKAASGTVGEAVHELWEAIRGFSRSAQSAHPILPRQPPAVLAAFRVLDRTPGSPGHTARCSVVNMLLKPAATEDVWAAQVASLQDALTTLTGIDHRKIAPETWSEWFAFTQAPVTTEPVAERPPNGVAAVLGTTASAKGETHSATLLLECLDRKGKKHDLARLLPYLTGKGGSLEAASMEVKHAACLAFVAVTRPRHLLALAVRHDSAEQYLPALHEMGWEVHSVRNQVEAVPKLCEEAPAELSGQLRIL